MKTRDRPRPTSSRLLPDDMQMASSVLDTSITFTLRDLKVTFGEIHALGDSSALQEVLEKHSKLFCNELGCLQGMKVKLNVDSDATPKFFKARTVPLALKEKVEGELENLESMGIISPVEPSRWAAPIVPVLKQNGAVRICGGYKVTVNQACLIDSYPLP